MTTSLCSNQRSFASSWKMPILTTASNCFPKIPMSEQERGSDRHRDHEKYSIIPLLRSISAWRVFNRQRSFGFLEQFKAIRGSSGRKRSFLPRQGAITRRLRTGTMGSTSLGFWPLQRRTWHPCRRRSRSGREELVQMADSGFRYRKQKEY